MKTALFTLFFALTCLIHAQCPMDSLELLGSPQYAMSSEAMTVQPNPCYQYQCDPSGCYSWQFPASFVGHLEITPQSQTVSQTFEIIVLQDCHLVRLDICRQVINTAGGGFDTILQFPPNSQLTICGQFGSIANVLIKPNPINPFGDTLAGPIFDLDTACTVAASVAEPQQPERYLYFDPVTLQQVSILQPNRAYLKRKIAKFVP